MSYYPDAGAWLDEPLFVDDDEFLEEAMRKLSYMEPEDCIEYIVDLISFLEIRLEDRKGKEFCITDVTKQFQLLLDVAERAPSPDTFAAAYRFIKVQCAKLGIVELFLESDCSLDQTLQFHKKYLKNDSMFTDIIGWHLLVDKTVYNVDHVKAVTTLLFEIFPTLWKLLLAHRVRNNENTTFGLHKTSLDVKLQQLSFPLSHTLLLLAHVLEGCEMEQKMDTLSDSFIFCIETLMQSCNHQISWAAAAVYLKSIPCWKAKYAKTHTKEETDSYSRQKITDLLPILIGTFSFQRTDEDSFNELITKYNLSYQLLPASLIVSSLQLVPEQNKFLNDIDFVQDLNQAIEEEFKKSRHSMDVLQCHQISMYLTILSFMAGIDDKTKLNIADGNLNLFIEDILRKHVAIVKNARTPCISNEMAVLMTYKITLASCVFLRALSRSASILRQYFTSNDFLDLLLNITSMRIEGIMSKRFSANETELYVVIMGLLSNLVLEFSANRNNIKVDRITDALRLTPLKGSSQQVLASLSLIRNALYGDDERFARKFLDMKVVRTCVEYSNSDDSNFKIVLESFNVIRNLLASTNNYKDEINLQIQSVRKYPSHLNPIVQYLCESLVTRVSYNSPAELIITILYGITHLAASTTEYKVLIVKQNELLELLLNLLKTPKTDTYTKDEFWELKTVIAWILIDLTSTSDPLTNNGTNSREILEDLSSVRGRAMSLMNLGFHHVLKSLANDSPSLDFVDRAGKAIFQMVVSTTQG